MNNTAVSQTRAGAKRGRMVKWIVGIVAVLVLLALVYFGGMLFRMSYVPPNLDFSTTRTTAQGLFKTTIRPGVDPIPTDQIHTWTLHVETPDGQPVDNATITLNGDMPQHGHGMPTQPVVSRYLGNGDYLVEGMKFQMTGWWEVNFAVNSGDKSDRVTFNLMLK